VRKIWARYYDLITYMDKEVRGLLDDLEADGLADSTIVFFFSDHGMGLPRYKRTLYDSGLRVPLMVRVPGPWQALAPLAPGGRTDRLVSFVDLPPTVLRLAGVPVPEHMQGRLSSVRCPPRRATISTGPPAGSTKPTRCRAACGTSDTSTSATSCRICPTFSPASTPTVLRL
jgi:arylsulfatase A-like enzyme